MKLMTKAIIEKLEKRGHGNEFKDEDEIIVKFFNPMGRGTWYVMEGEKQSNGDWFLFGLADLWEKEWGYISLDELQSVKLPLGLGMERDMHFSGTYKDLKELQNAAS